MVCASTGNTSASMAAYAAQAGLKPLVLVPAGQDRGRQAGAGDRARRAGDHGARQLRRLPAAGPRARRGLPGRAGQLGQPGAARGPEDRGLRDRRLPRRRPRRHVLPVGNAGNISAYWKGYREYADGSAGPPKTPQMRGFQAAGAAPLVTGEPVPDPETVATAIRIGNPASWQLAVAAAHESGGRFARRHRRPDPGRPARAGRARRRLRRAGLRRRRRRAAAGGRGGGVVRRQDRRRHRHRPRAQGHRHRASRASADSSTP